MIVDHVTETYFITENENFMIYLKRRSIKVVLNNMKNVYEFYKIIKLFKKYCKKINFKRD